MLVRPSGSGDTDDGGLHTVSLFRCLESSGIREHPLLCGSQGGQEDMQLGYIIDAQYDAPSDRL